MKKNKIKAGFRGLVYKDLQKALWDTEVGLQIMSSKAQTFQTPN